MLVGVLFSGFEDRDFLHKDTAQQYYLYPRATPDAYVISPSSTTA